MIPHTVILMAALGLTAGQNPVSKADRQDLKDLQGTWRVQSVQGYNSVKNKDEMKEVRLTIHGRHIKAAWGTHTAEADFVLRPTQNPAAIDITLIHGPKELEGKTFLGRYVLEGDTWRIAYRNPGEKRPMEMTTIGEAHAYQVFLKRLKK